MANFGQPDTNNSQFFITTVECSHLNGTHVVVGYVLRGMGLIGEMEKFTDNEGQPTADIIIDDCGELEENNDWNYHDNDETDDNLPPFPADWDQSAVELSVDYMVETLERIRGSGNHFYKKENYVEALRKYNKMTRFYRYFSNLPMQPEDRCRLDHVNEVNGLNLAAAHLKLGNFKDVIYACNEALKSTPKNAKALFRRGVAQIEEKNYEAALADLKEAHSLNPEAKDILGEFNRGKDLLMNYRETEKESIRKMFKLNN